MNLWILFMGSIGLSLSGRPFVPSIAAKRLALSVPQAMQISFLDGPRSWIPFFAARSDSAAEAQASPRRVPARGRNAFRMPCN